MTNRRTLVFTIALGALSFASQLAYGQTSLSAEWGNAMKWREIGPAGMGGRVTCIEVDPNDPSTFWVGFGAGGVVKTVNKGVTFEHQFNDGGTSSIGSIAVSPSDSKIVWIGTGENNPRNSVSYGDGVYKSEDGGKTWKNMGLKETFQIGKIIVHPKNPNIVYVGALGRLWGPNADRGLFKTTDGGKTWQKIHYVDDKTGVIDMVMDPRNPDTLYFATWERQRDPYDQSTGTPPVPDGFDGYDPMHKWGPGAGIWKTTDGGKTVRRLRNGLPTAYLGRVGLSIYAKNPRILYAIVDSERIGGGEPLPTVYFGFLADPDKGGIKVTQVTNDGPSGKAGLKQGDIITGLNGKKPESMREVFALLRSSKEDDKVKIDYLRDGKKATAEVTLARRPGVASGSATANQVFGGILERENEGLKVVRVRESGQAKKAGFLENDILLEADGKALKDPSDLIAIFKSKKVKDTVKFKVKRGQEIKEFTFTMVDPLPGSAEKQRPYLAELAGQDANLQDQQGEPDKEFGGIYRSDDGGENWKRVNSLNPRPMYFGRVAVDPNDDKNVYVLGVSQYQSHNGGITFTEDFGNSVHADGHAIWIDPSDSRHMLIGCDGGFYSTYDTGKTWEHLNNVAVGQFYHVAFDSRAPYHVYGGLQDNGSWGGPTQSVSDQGPMNEDWINIGGGDGFVCQVDPFDPNIVYGESQGGAMYRRNLKTGEVRGIRPKAVPNKKFVFNWDNPFIVSKHNPGIFYTAGNYVFKSVDRGDTLLPISPEITRSSKGCGSAISESPKNSNVVWAGTDDGYVWITQDGGQKWENITDKIGVNKPFYVATLEASRFSEGRAYVCFAAHRSNDDNPYIYVTEDFGKTWKSLKGNLPWGTSRSLREDPLNENLLYCGTETGLYASTDRGTTWSRINGNLPTVPVFDVAINPATRELIAATHGRSLWVCDVSPLQGMTEASGKETANLYAPAPAILWRREASRGYGSGDEKFFGTNRARGATIWYSLTQEAKKVTIKLLDITGKVVREFPGQTKPGLYNVQWDGRMGPVTGDFQYKVVMTVDDKEYSTVLDVRRDPTLEEVPERGDAEFDEEEEHGEPIKRAIGV
ncbi:MAG: PDZ domain-containing protein [Armatimonadetes bacterium]|nr:PDZ domain-containing protein [Armatimonadota bacterium]